MRTSDNITELATALSIAQGQFKPLLKTCLNPHLNKKYADLAAVRDSVIEALSANGLSFLQAIEAASDARSLLCITRVMHKSGEWYESELALPIVMSEKQNPLQSAGGAITYLRKYTLSAVLGLAADDDDDGESANGAAPTQAARPQPVQQKQQPRASQANVAPQAQAVDVTPTPELTPIQAKKAALKALTETEGFWPDVRDKPAMAVCIGNLLSITLNAGGLVDVDALCLIKAREELEARADARRAYFAAAPDGLSKEDSRARIGRLLGVEVTSRRMLTAAQWRAAAENERMAATVPDADADPFSEDY